MIEFTLPSMTCGHCAQTVTQAVRRVDPNARLHIDLAARVVKIESDRSVQEFRCALAEEGYAPAT